MTKRSFQHQVVVITGASSGIGRATALLFAELNAQVVLVSRNLEKLSAVRDEILEKGGQALVIQADVSKFEETQRITRETVSRWGQIDILIACAGKYVQGPAHKLDIGTFEESFAVNFFGTLHVVKSVLPEMQRGGRGHIVIVNSLDAKKGIVGDSPYVSAKAALDGFGDVLRQEMRDQNIRVTSIYPGRVDTPMIEDIKVPWSSPKIPPEKVARVIISGIKKNRAVMVVPSIYKPLLSLNMIAPRLLDWFYRILKIEGEKIRT